MNKNLLILSLVTAALLSAYGGYRAGQQSSAGPHVADGASAEVVPSGEAKPERKVLYYRNPMGLPDTSPTPKKDSMGMDYVPVYEGDEPSGEGAVKVSPARLQTLGVKTARAQVQKLDVAVRAVGRVEVNERRIHDVAPRFEGWIERLYVNATGDPVRKGQPLFSVYSPELVSARKELAVAQSLRLDAPDADPSAREAARRLATAARERLANWQMGGVEDASGSGMIFNSPAAGIVLEKKAVEGMRFTPGAPIYRIADLSSIWVIADIYEKDLSRIKVGEAARVGVDAFPDRFFDARIAYVYPTLNPATRTTPVRLELHNHDGLLRPGMFAHVELATGGIAPRLTVPRSALIDSGERQIVLRVVGEGKFQPQPVKVGLRGKDAVEILDGLEAGSEIVVAANFLIDAESNLKAALATFADPKPVATVKSYSAMGAIDAIDAANNTLSVNHEAIPALQWPAMTMDFGLDDAGIARGMLPGQSVHFTFEDRGNGEFVITRLEQMDGKTASGHQGAH